MKRKSILMMIVALLFAGTAMAQPSGAWYTNNGGTIATVKLSANGNNLLTTPYDNVKGTSVAYFCSTADSLYPIELGYNVAGKNLDHVP